MSITYRTSADDWSPGYMATYIHDDGRFAVVIDGRPVFSGTGYQPGPFHDDRERVADILFGAYWKLGGEVQAGGSGYPFADDLVAVAEYLANVT